MNNSAPKYKRLILKISGEALGNQDGDIFDPAALSFLARNVKEVADLGVEVGIVGGGGNIVRGVTAVSLGIERTTADQMGMLATVINGIALREGLEQAGLKVRLFSCVPVGPIAEPYLPRNARRALASGEVAVFSGGTGNPFVSTDTAALLRACDTEAEAVLKATKVDGVYSADPVKDPGARKFDAIAYDEALKRGLKIMDFSAMGLAKENNIPVIVFDFWEEQALKRVVLGEKLGTIMK
jgi:uridylate kinase